VKFVSGHVSFLFSVFPCLLSAFSRLFSVFSGKNRGENRRLNSCRLPDGAENITFFENLSKKLYSPLENFPENGIIIKY